MACPSDRSLPLLDGFLQPSPRGRELTLLARDMSWRRGDGWVRILGFHRTGDKLSNGTLTLRSGSVGHFGVASVTG